MTPPTEKDYWVLWHRFYDEIGPQHFYHLLKFLGSAKKAWEAPESAFQKIGWGPKALEKLKIRNKGLVTVTSSSNHNKKYDVITREEKAYPSGLSSISAPPPVIFARGEISRG